MAGECYHILYSNIYGIRSCALRLTNTIGPRMRIRDARQTFVGVWIKRLLENEPFEVWGGNQLRDFTFVDDCVEALLLAAASDQSNGRIFNLGGDQVVSLMNLAKLLVEINGSGEYIVRPFPSNRKKIDIGDYYSDSTLIRNTLGWKPQINLNEGLKRTLNFFKDNMKYYL